MSLYYLLFVWAYIIAFQIIRGPQTPKGTSPWNPLSLTPNMLLQIMQCSDQSGDDRTNFNAVVSTCQTLALNYASTPHSPVRRRHHHFRGSEMLVPSSKPRVCAFPLACCRQTDAPIRSIKCRMLRMGWMLKKSTLIHRQISL